MSAPKGIRLWLRPAREGHAAVWIIRDGSRQTSTGCGASEIDEANRRLGAYIAAQHKPERPNGRDLSQIPVADVLSLYFEEKAQHSSRPEAARGRLRMLVEFFGLTMLSDINTALCRSYTTQRGSEQAAPSRA